MKRYQAEKKKESLPIPNKIPPNIQEQIDNGNAIIVPTTRYNKGIGFVVMDGSSGKRIY